MKKLIEFYNKWSKYIKQNESTYDTINAVRDGEKLPTDLMNEFLELSKVIP